MENNQFLPLLFILSNISVCVWKNTIINRLSVYLDHTLQTVQGIVFTYLRIRAFSIRSDLRIKLAYIN